jgi:hypothetical protein
LLFLLCASPALAQSPSALYFKYRDRTQWPTSLGTPGAVTRLVSGDFTGDGLKDALALVDGHPILLFGPDTWSSIVKPDTTFACADIDSIPYPGDNKAGLITVGSNGLIELTYKPSPLGFTWSQRSTDAIWATATQIKACDFNSNGTFDFVGVCPAHDSVPTKIALLIDGGSPAGHTTTFSLPGISVYDVGVLQYDGSDQKDIMTLDSYGVEVFTTTGSRIKRFARPTSTVGDAFCSFKKGASIYEHIAWFRMNYDSDNNLAQQLVELHWESDVNASQLVTDAGFLPSSGRVVRASAIAPTTDPSSIDSNANLLLTCLSNWQPTRINYSTTAIGYPTYSVSSLEDIHDPLALPDPTQITGSAYAIGGVVDDFGNDSVPDLLLPVVGSSGLNFLFYRGGSTPPTAQPLSTPNFMAAPDIHVTGSSQNRLTLYVDLGDPVDGANALEITIWSCPPTASNLDPVTYRNEAHYYYQDASGNYPALDENGSLFPQVLLQLTNNDGINSYDTDDPCFPLLYWIQAVQSHRDLVTGVLRPKGPVYVGVLGSTRTALTPWVETDSQSACIDVGELNASTCTDDSGCDPNALGVTPVTSPGAVARHRMAPTTGGGAPPTPNPPAPGTL